MTFKIGDHVKRTNRPTEQIDEDEEVLNFVPQMNEPYCFGGSYDTEEP